MIGTDHNRNEKLLPKTSKCSNLIKSDIADQLYQGGGGMKRWHKPGNVTLAQVNFTS